MPQLYTREQIAEFLNCTVEDVEVRWQRGEVDSYNIESQRRYALVERGASESNAPEAGRSRKAGSAGHRTYSDRREYMRAYQRAWIAKRRADFFAGKTCLDCGAGDGLELHHRDPALKVDHKVWTWSAERREVEVAKCDVICNDCHLRRHGKVPGGRHGGKHRYELGCRCNLCVSEARKRRRIRYAKERA